MARVLDDIQEKSFSIFCPSSGAKKKVKLILRYSDRVLDTRSRTCAFCFLFHDIWNWRLSALLASSALTAENARKAPVNRGSAVIASDCDREPNKLTFHTSEKEEISKIMAQNKNSRMALQCRVIGWWVCFFAWMPEQKVSHWSYASGLSRAQRTHLRKAAFQWSVRTMLNWSSKCSHSS